MRGSNVTIACPPLRSTRSACTRVTPGTLSSADRTATMHPSQSIPSIPNVTVADRGEVRQALTQRATVTNHWRLVMMSSYAQSHHENTRMLTAKIRSRVRARNQGCEGLTGHIQVIY